MKLNINRATKNDLPLMQRLFYLTVTSFGSTLFSKEEIKMYTRLASNKGYWEKKFKKDFIYNAKLNGEIVGSFVLTVDGNIEYFFVNVKYQGKGIASALYSVLEKVAIESNIKILTTHVNKRTRAFFEKKGYQIIENSLMVIGLGEPKSYNGIKSLKN